MSDTWDVGDLVPLGVTLYDSAGDEADGDTVTLTVTRPDGTTYTGTLTSTPTGVYGYDFPTTMVGRYEWTITSTGANASSYSDVFNVTDAHLSIVGLGEARAALNWSDSDTSNDEELRSFLDAATEVVEDLVGPVVTRTYSEQHTSGGRAIALNHYPVLAVSSFVEYTPAAITWTKADNPAAAAGNQFTINTTNGVIKARWGASFTGECWVTYTAGRAVTPPAIREACVEIVKSRWQQSQQGNARPDLGGVSVTGGSGKTYIVPYLAEALLKPYMQAGGFA